MEEDDESKPWLQKSFDRWEVNARGDGLIVNCGANETIEIDKMFGPLAATGVRVRLEYHDEIADWVIEREKLIINPDGNSGETQWIEMARWYCQMDWPK